MNQKLADAVRCTIYEEDGQIPPKIFFPQCQMELISFYQTTNKNILPISYECFLLLTCSRSNIDTNTKLLFEKSRLIALLEVTEEQDVMLVHNSNDIIVVTQK